MIFSCEIWNWSRDGYSIWIITRGIEGAMRCKRWFSHDSVSTSHSMQLVIIVLFAPREVIMFSNTPLKTTWQYCECCGLDGMKDGVERRVFHLTTLRLLRLCKVCGRWMEYPYGVFLVWYWQETTKVLGDGGCLQCNFLHLPGGKSRGDDVGLCAFSIPKLRKWYHWK